jgi:hypothetical protein
VSIPFFRCRKQAVGADQSGLLAEKPGREVLLKNMSERAQMMLEAGENKHYKPHFLKIGQVRSSLISIQI